MEPINTRGLTDAAHTYQEVRTGPDGWITPPSHGVRWDTPLSSEPTTPHPLLDGAGAGHCPAEAVQIPAEPSDGRPSRETKAVSQPPVDTTSIQRVYNTALWDPPAEGPERTLLADRLRGHMKQLLPELAALLPRVQGSGNRSPTPTAATPRPARTSPRPNTRSPSTRRSPWWKPGLAQRAGPPDHRRADRHRRGPQGTHRGRRNRGARQAAAPPLTPRTQAPGTGTRRLSPGRRETAPARLPDASREVPSGWLRHLPSDAETRPASPCVWSCHHMKCDKGTAPLIVAEDWLDC